MSKKFVLGMFMPFGGFRFDSGVTNSGADLFPEIFLSCQQIERRHESRVFRVKLFSDRFKSGSMKPVEELTDGICFPVDGSQRPFDEAHLFAFMTNINQKINISSRAVRDTLFETRTVINTALSAEPIRFDSVVFTVFARHDILVRLNLQKGLHKRGFSVGFQIPDRFGNLI